MKILEFKATEQLNNKTLKHLLFNTLELSDKLVADLKKGDFIFVNGEKCTVRKELKTGDIVKITIPETEKSDIVPVKGELEILFEDEDIIDAVLEYVYSETEAGRPISYSKDGRVVIKDMEDRR